MQLDAVPDSLRLIVSADNRYNLFFNGERVAYSPAEGNLKTYKYDVVDIAPFLVKGNKILAILVHNAGAEKPLSFLSAKTAFLCQPYDDRYRTVFGAQDW